MAQVAEQGWTFAAAAKMFMVSPRTAAKWVQRYRAEGPAAMGYEVQPKSLVQETSCRNPMADSKSR